MYVAAHKKLLCLVNDKKKKTIEDVVISVDIKTKKTKKLVDFAKLMSASRKKHVQRKGGKNTYGGTELDWLHLNSLDLINEWRTNCEQPGRKFFGKGQQYLQKAENQVHHPLRLPLQKDIACKVSSQADRCQICRTCRSAYDYCRKR